MIEKKHFYHGAVLVPVVEDARCASIAKNGAGYKVNGKVFVYPKYSTKDRTPWNFSFTEDEISQLTGIAGVEERVVVAFVCGGDGVCAVVWENVFALLGGPSQTWISCRRKFNQQYAVSGSLGKIKGKVAIQEWPSMVFSD